MNLLSFNKQEIETIYDYLAIHSLSKYNLSKENIQDFYKDEIKTTLNNIKSRNLSTKIGEYNLTEITQTLDDYQTIYNNIQEQNKDIILSKSKEIENIIIETISKEKTELDKITFLFDFITSYITYSEDYYNYCLNQPFNSFYIFDFKNNIPVDHTKEGTLVTGQGLCTEISYLISYIGHKLNLQIDTLLVEYKEDSHNINIIKLSDGNNYLIDATRLIRKDKTKEECFLVSEELLNKNKDYIFRQKLSTKTYTGNIPNYKNEANLLKEKIKSQLPNVVEYNPKTTRSI